MKKVKGRMDERILVCISSGPNGLRLIRRGHKLASMLDCPLFILTIDSLPRNEFNPEKKDYIDQWQQLSAELEAEEFILMDNEKRPFARTVAEVVNEYNITQIIIGQSPQSRWEEITKRSFINVLLREVSFADIHVVALDRTIKNNEEAHYEKGIRCYLIKRDDQIHLCFQHPGTFLHEGIFYKEVGTDFNNGIFKLSDHGKAREFQVAEDILLNPEALPDQTDTNLA